MTKRQWLGPTDQADKGAMFLVMTILLGVFGGGREEIQ